MTPSVSILVPTFNCAHYLPLLCESIQRQSFSDFEVLLWDDGSTDNTVQVVSPFLRDQRFHLLQAETNQGLGKSWRELLLRARGEYWCSPGADDILFPDYLQRRVAALRSRPGAALVHGRPEHIDENGKELKDITTVSPQKVTDGAAALRALLQHNYINQPSALVRTEVTNRLLPYWKSDWKYAPDWHLWMLHAATGGDFLYDAEPAHQYRIHSHSLTAAQKYEAVRRAEIRLVPLCACADAAHLSNSGKDIWQQWRRPLYALWLRRAWVFRKNPIIPEMLRIAAEKFYGFAITKAPKLSAEIYRHFVGVIWFSLKESLARRRQRIFVSGLAQVDDGLFRKG